MITQITSWLFTLIVFPGLLFTIALALFTQYLIRKWSGRLQKRMGPTYVGPFGILQTFYDLVKLIHVKEEVVHKYCMPGVAKLFGLIGIAAAVSIIVFFPLSPFRVISDFDYLIYTYMISIWVPLAFILMSLSMPGPYTSIGVSRYLTLVTIIEPAYFTSLLVPMIIVSETSKPVYSIYITSTSVWKLWLNPYTVIPILIALISSVVTLQAKGLYNPFNIPEAEQEVIAGYETEFSGPVLGIARLLHDIDVTITALSIVYILLGGPYPFSHLSIPGVLILIIKYLIVIYVSTLIKNIFGRYRLEQALYILFKYSLIPSIIATILATVYVLVS